MIPWLAWFVSVAAAGECPGPVELEQDTDGDGLTDVLEREVFHTDPGREDTDQDRLADGDEVELGTDPLNDDTDGDGEKDGRDGCVRQVDGDTCALRRDCDGDGLSDHDEGGDTAICDADSDNGGEPDGEEDVHDRDPANREDDRLFVEPGPDQDGLSEAFEVELFESDPDSGDTDEDYSSDDEELRRGTLPWQPDTDGDEVLDGHDPEPLVADRDHDGLLDGRDPTPDDPDRDQDGLLDGLEEALGTDPGAADVDGDGLDDRRELEAGTDPLVYDSDGDGLDDGSERDRLGTDPCAPDTDGGGVPDGDEDEAGTDPLDAGDDDVDGDGLGNDAEERLGTDPGDPDTDGDGLSDGLEVDLGTDPTAQDTDGDDLDDGTEVELGTDPTEPDSDGDGLDDGQEVGDSDPLDPADPPATVGPFPPETPRPAGFSGSGCATTPQPASWAVALLLAVATTRLPRRPRRG